MYIVEDKKFDDFIEACQYCKENPLTRVINDSGEILMIHEYLSDEEASDIRVIQLLLQIRDITKCSRSFLPSGFGSTLSFLGSC